MLWLYGLSLGTKERERQAVDGYDGARGRKILYTQSQNLGVYSVYIVPCVRGLLKRHVKYMYVR